MPEEWRILTRAPRSSRSEGFSEAIPLAGWAVSFAAIVEHFPSRASRGQLIKLRKEHEAKIVAALRDALKKKRKEMLGKPIDLAK
jgi:hypothetical protein